MLEQFPPILVEGITRAFIAEAKSSLTEGTRKAFALVRKLLQRDAGEDAASINGALDALEKAPDKQGPRRLLEGTVVDAIPDPSKDLVDAVNALRAALDTDPGSRDIKITVSNNKDSSIAISTGGDATAISKKKN